MQVPFQKFCENRVHLSFGGGRAAWEPDRKAIEKDWKNVDIENI